MILSDYVRILVRRGWIVVLAVILTAGCAYIFSQMQTQIYRATQNILIQPARNDLGLAEAIKRLISSYRVRLDATARAQEVINDLKLDLTPDTLHANVTVSSNLDTLTLSVDVDSPDAQLAAKIARKYGENFFLWRESENAPLRQEDRIKAELLDYPTAGLFRPNKTINTLAGALLGVILGGIIVFALELFSATIVRRSDDIERYLELPVLGTLPSLE